MSDIVERLREEAERSLPSSRGYMVNEAAAEIERLRARERELGGALAKTMGACCDLIMAGARAVKVHKP